MIINIEPVVRSVPEIFIGRLISADEVKVEASESTNKPQRNKAVSHENNRCRRFFHSPPYCALFIIHQNLNIESTHGKYIDAEKHCRRNEAKEVAVVAQPYALPHPWAMMIKAFNTIVTN
nr:hypothetical protein Iba_chr14dCG16630 [Ipomoea batatas]GME04760.1 hypothetical protein Iba_scaffold2300CG1720 [Ipomoea batatas]